VDEIESTHFNQSTPETGDASLVARNAAIALIDEGNALEEQGRTSEAMARYDAAVQIDPQCARGHLNRGNMLARTQPDEARSAFLFALMCDPHYAGAHFNLGNLNYRVGNFELALINYQSALEIRPDFTDARVAMGNTLEGLGRIDEAIESYIQALTINPRYAEAHFNLGVLATARGREEEAASSLRRAVEIKPDYSQAYHNLGLVLSRLGQLDAAETSLRQAWSLEPKSAEILNDLLTILLCRGKSPEAVQLAVRALDRTPRWSTKVAFAACVARTKFTTNDVAVRKALTIAITEAWGMPYELCQPALSLIMCDERIAKCVRMSNDSWPVKPSKTTLFGSDSLVALAGDHLLHALLEAGPVSSIEFERFLTCARNILLQTAMSKSGPDESDSAALQFYGAISRQCFVNEYIFVHDDSELSVAADARKKLVALMDASAVVPPFLLLAVAAYFPLCSLPGAKRLFPAAQSGSVDEVLRQQIREPLEEQTLREGVRCLTSITGGISEEVRGQYEQNPYPRWVKVPMRDQALRFNDELRHSLPFAKFVPLPDDSAPEVLVAGCGTGAHPIFVAQRFNGARILALDLSLSSLSYAKRKTQELGLKNIEYAQADILKLGDIPRSFDVVESRGVLHHLADPFTGWRILLSLLRPGGFMGLGFYSEVARRQVVKARDFIATRGYASTPDDIRKFRQDLVAADTSVELKWLSKMTDFFSTSDCRDLFFHVQEHRLTLRQIESFLVDFGLHFIGFELDARVLQTYRARFADDPHSTNLRNWDRFEADNPDTFVNMYQFWIQKPIVA
jgi:Tfp pilus assembly protein PilF/SAM-dependent methyltransferase